MKARRKSTDEILEELLQDDSPPRPLTGTEILSMLCIGNIPPGRYETELCQPEGIVEVESFVVSEDGEIGEHQARKEKKNARGSKGKIKTDQ